MKDLKWIKPELMCVIQLTFNGSVLIGTAYIVPNKKGKGYIVELELYNNSADCIRSIPCNSIEHGQAIVNVLISSAEAIFSGKKKVV